MRPATLLLQVLLLAAGFLTYDLFRSGRSPSVREETQPAPVHGSVEDLRGAPSDDPRIAELMARLARLEARLATQELPPPSAASNSEPRAAPRPAPPPPRPVALDDLGVSVEDVARLRVLLEAVERQRRAETVRQSVAAALRRTEEDLGPEQRDLVLAEALRVWAEADRTSRELAAEAAPRADRVKALEAHRTDLGSSLARILDAARAQRVAETVSRAIGLRAGATDTGEGDDEGG